MHLQEVSTRVYFDVKSRLGASAAGRPDPYTRWGKWFFGDRAARTISPLSELTVPNYIKNRIKANTLESLDEAEKPAFGQPELMQRISQARDLLNNTRQAKARLDEGRWAAAEALYCEVLTSMRRVSPDESPESQAVIEQLAYAMIRQEKYSELEALLGEEQKLKAIAEKTQEEGDRSTWRADWQTAERLYSETLALRRRFWPKNGAGLMDTMARLAEVLQNQGRRAEAEAFYREILAMRWKSAAENVTGLTDVVGRLALVLQSQGKDAELERIFSELLAEAKGSNTVSAGLLRCRGVARARHGQFAGASEDLIRSIQIDPSEHWNYYQLQPLLLHQGDVSGYDNYCRAMLARFGKTSEPTVAERIAKGILLRPQSGEALDQACRLAENAVALGENFDCLSYFYFVHGLAEYRRGHFAAAGVWLERASKDAEDIPSLQAQVYSVMAMALHELKEPAQAQAALSEGCRIVEKELPRLDRSDLGEGWHDVLIAYILMREAKRLIECAVTVDKEK